MTVIIEIKTDLLVFAVIDKACLTDLSQSYKNYPPGMRKTNLVNQYYESEINRWKKYPYIVDTMPLYFSQIDHSITGYSNPIQ